jgi:hypothetical protein
MMIKERQNTEEFTSGAVRRLIIRGRLFGDTSLWCICIVYFCQILLLLLFSLSAFDYHYSSTFVSVISCSSPVLPLFHSLHNLYFITSSLQVSSLQEKKGSWWERYWFQRLWEHREKRREQYIYWRFR